MGAGLGPQRSAPPRSHASAQLAGLAAWRRHPFRSHAPRLSNRRGAARSGRASVGIRLQGPPRCVALHPPRGPMGLCLVATPSAGPAHSTGREPGRTQGHQLYLVRPLGDPVRLSGERRKRCSSGRGQPLGSWRHRLPEHPVTRSRRPTSPRPNDRQALRLAPAALPADCSTLPPQASSRSPDPGRRRPSRVRSALGRGVHGQPAQVQLRRGLSRCPVIRRVRQTGPARRALQLRASRRHVGPRPRLAHQLAVNPRRRRPGRRQAPRPLRPRPLRPTPPQPRVA
jgi:hypothetical protein